MAGTSADGIRHHGVVGGLGRAGAEAIPRRTDGHEAWGTSHGGRPRVTIALGRSSARKGREKDEHLNSTHTAADPVA